MSAACLLTTASLVSPPPPELSLGWMLRMVSSSSLAVLLWYLDRVQRPSSVCRTPAKYRIGYLPNTVQDGCQIQGTSVSKQRQGQVLYKPLDVRDVGIGMHAKHLRGIVERQAVDVGQVVLGGPQNRDVVALVEVETGLEHELSKPTLHRVG